jgi:sensor domain CHASE-containing protein
MVFDKKVFSNTMRSKIKKIQRSVSKTLQLATRKNVIQMSSDVITMENCHY